MKIAKLLILVIALLLSGSALSSCGALRTQSDVDQVLEICDDCGELKGFEACCENGFEICRECGLHKDSPGCCVIEKGAGDRPLCDDCGQIKGTRGCCNETAKRCPDCGKIKHSPGCCR